MNNCFSYKTALSVISFLLLCVFFPSTSSGFSRSLSSHLYKLPDAVIDSAELLEQFGEVERAYELVRSVCPDASMLSASERALSVRLLVKLGLYKRAEQLLATTTSPTTTTELFCHKLLRARLNVLFENYTEALGFISVLDKMDVQAYNDYRDFLAMEIYTQLGDSDKASDIGLHLFSEGYLSTLTPEFENNLLITLMNARRYQEASELIRKLNIKFAKSKSLIPFLKEEIKIYYLLGDSVKARQQAIQFVDRYTSSEEALEIARHLLKAISPSALDNGELMTCCKAFFDNGEMADMKDVLQILEKRELDEKDAEKVRYYRTHLLYKAKRYMEALNRLEQPYIARSLARKADLLTARCYRGLGQTLKAAKAYEAFSKKYPHDGIAAEALTVSADLYERVNYITKSREIKELLVKKYSRSYFGQLSALKLSFHYTQKKQHEESIAILRKGLTRTSPKSESMLYYLSQSYGRMGMDNKKTKTLETLHSIDPHSFYFYPEIENTTYFPTISSQGKIDLVSNNGLLPLLRSIDAKREEAYSILSGHLKRDEQAENLWQVDSGLERARFFFSAGFIDWGVGELEDFEKRWRTEDHAILTAGKLYNNHSLAWNGVRVFGRLKYRLPGKTSLEVKEVVEQLLYPTPFPGFVLENCITHNLPPHLMFALVREESRFDVKAVSRAGALGLMQLMPETGKSIAHKLDFPLHEDETLFTPEVNLSFGMWYAAYLLERCDGNYHMMLTSYNAGLRNARRWFTKKKMKGDIRFVVDNIGYKETRRYVKKIVESATIYSKLYFPGDDHLSVSTVNTSISQ